MTSGGSGSTSSLHIRSPESGLTTSSSAISEIGGHTRHRAIPRAWSYGPSPRQGSSGQGSFSVSSCLPSCGRGALHGEHARRDSRSPASWAPVTGSSTPRATGFGSYPPSRAQGWPYWQSLRLQAPPDNRPARKVRIVRLRVAAAAAAAFVAAAALAVPWAAVSLIDAAVARGPARSSYSLLDTAATLNPWSEQPALARARLDAEAGRSGQERIALLAALRRNPNDWYPYLILGIIAGREHQTALARAELARARRLSPQALVISWAQTRLRLGPPAHSAPGRPGPPGGLKSTFRGARQLSIAARIRLTSPA